MPHINITGTGSTFTIWGRKQCPNNTDTEQVYSGKNKLGYFEFKTQ